MARGNDENGLRGKETIMALAGKEALITGGSRSLGAATAKRLASDGVAVALAYGLA